MIKHTKKDLFIKTPLRCSNFVCSRSKSYPCCRRRQMRLDFFACMSSYKQLLQFWLTSRSNLVITFTSKFVYSVLDAESYQHKVFYSMDITSVKQITEHRLTSESESASDSIGDSGEQSGANSRLCLGDISSSLHRCSLSTQDELNDDWRRRRRRRRGWTVTEQSQYQTDCLFVCLVFNGTFRTHRLYSATEVWSLSRRAGGQYKHIMHLSNETIQ